MALANIDPRVPRALCTTALCLLMVTALAVLRAHATPLPTSGPTVNIKRSDTVYWYVGAPVELDIIIAPEGAAAQILLNDAPLLRTPGARLEKVRGTHFRLTYPVQEGTSCLKISARIGRTTAHDSVFVITMQPTLRKFGYHGSGKVGCERPRFLRAYYNLPYNPSCAIEMGGVSARDLQTEVTLNDSVVFSEEGSEFPRLTDAQKRALVVPSNIHPTQLRTRIFWKPNGTLDRSKWRILAANHPDIPAAIPLESGKMELIWSSHPPGADRTWMVRLSPSTPRWESLPVVIDGIEDPSRRDIPVEIRCADCSSYGLHFDLHDTIVAIGGPGTGVAHPFAVREWRIAVSADDARFLVDNKPTLTGRCFYPEAFVDGRAAPGVDFGMFVLVVDRH